MSEDCLQKYKNVDIFFFSLLYKCFIGKEPGFVV